MVAVLLVSCRDEKKQAQKITIRIDAPEPPAEVTQLPAPRPNEVRERMPASRPNEFRERMPESRPGEFQERMPASGSNDFQENAPDLVRQLMEHFEDVKPMMHKILEDETCKQLIKDGNPRRLSDYLEKNHEEEIAEIKSVLGARDTDVVAMTMANHLIRKSHAGKGQQPGLPGQSEPDRVGSESGRFRPKPDRGGPDSERFRPKSDRGGSELDGFRPQN